MQVVYHIGAHSTDEERILKCLLKNKETLGKSGVAVPGPSRYRRLIRETVNALDQAAPDHGTQEALLDAILEEDHVTRLILSGEHFMGVPDRVFGQNTLYPLAEKKTQALARLLPAEEIEFHIGIRNPATFVPEVFSRANGNNLDSFLGGMDMREVRWSDLIRRIRASVPNALVTVWSNEDTPLIWSEIIREMAGLDPTIALEGMFDLLSEIMSPAGMARFDTYMKTHPPQTEMQSRRVISAFLDKFALEDMVVDELDIEGWTGDFVDEISDRYDEDMETIQAMQGVKFISP